MDIYTVLYRYIQGNATEDEKRVIVLWLQEDEKHVLEYRSIRKIVDYDNWNTKEQSILHNKKRFSIQTISKEILKIVAVLAFGILTTYSLMNRKSLPTEMQTIYVPAGQRSKLSLSDGTIVWLNSGTTIKFPTNFSKNQREVIIDGEAFFSVAKNKDKPFIVNTERNYIKVLGTEFNVKAYEGKEIFEIALLEGSIEVIHNDNNMSYLLKENETFISKNDKVTKGTIIDYNYFKWRDGLICFEKESITSLFEKLELYYDINIENKNESILKGSYTGKFRVRDGIEHVLKVLQLKHQFSFKKDEDTNTIIIE